MEEKNLQEPFVSYGKPFTYADYLTWQIDERIELIKGKIFSLFPAPARYHQDVSRNLLYALVTYFNSKNCKVYDAPFDVRLVGKNKDKIADNEITTVVQPDICIICDLEKLDDRGCIGAPDLIIEILSPGNSKKELKNKFELYEENGVREYWLVDYQAKTVLIYYLENNQYRGLKILTEDEVAKSVIFHDLEIELKTVFKE